MSDKNLNHINPNVNSTSAPIVLNEEKLAKMADKLMQGDRFALAKCITLIESEKLTDVQKSIQLLNKIRTSDSTLRIAITGSPGVGKSSLIEILGTRFTEQNIKTAVLAIDPSSSISKGSILGDKTRMEKLSTNSKAFVRPSSAGSTLGGVASKTRESILLCEAAGFKNIMVETVGVGQSETLVSQMTDLTILLLLPGAGDELQGIKRGIVELADIIVVHKADQVNSTLSRQTKKDYQNALHILKQTKKFWSVPVIEVSSIEETGFDELLSKINDFNISSRSDMFFNEERIRQNLYWFNSHLLQFYEKLFIENNSLVEQKEKLIEEIQANQKLAYIAAFEFFESLKLKNS